MLPPPPIRLTSTLRDVVRRLDSHTLWAFNPQPQPRPAEPEKPRVSA